MYSLSINVCHTVIQVHVNTTLLRKEKRLINIAMRHTVCISLLYEKRKKKQQLKDRSGCCLYSLQYLPVLMKLHHT